MRNPRRESRASKIFWSLVLAPFAVVAVIIVLIIAGAFGKLPTFEELENPRSNIATEIISSDGEVIGNFFVENRSYIDYGDLSPYLVQALVATEDSRFYSHSGIDFLGLARVGFKTVLMGDKGQGGGSTISQQLAKNLYPRDTVVSRGVAKVGRLFIAKFKEWITATMLEYNYTKEEIIAMYLNTVEFGANAFGVKSAARTFFNKYPSELTLEESAMLVGMVNKPTRYNPKLNPQYALERRNTVIERMYQAGTIDNERAKESKSKPIELDYRPISHNAGTGTYFREMIRQLMTAKEPERRSFSNDWDYQVAVDKWKNDPRYGWCNKNTKADGEKYNLYKDGLKITVTVNAKMQRYAEEAMWEQMKDNIQPQFDNQRKGYKNIFFNIKTDEQQAIINSAMMQSERGRKMRAEGVSREDIIAAFNKPERMTVFTYKGERDTTMTPRDSIIHYKAILRSGFTAIDPATGYVLAYVGGTSFKHFKYDMASQGRRQVGSTVKPFIYTFAIDHLGYNPCTLVPNLEVTIDTGSGEPWSPREAGKVEYDGELHPLKWGLAMSRNNYSAWIMKQSSPQAVTDLIHKFGISGWIDPVVAVCVGTPEVTVLEMVSAFATFANRGVHIDPFFITRIEDRQGNVLATFSPTSNDVISEQTAFTMLGMMQNNINAGTGGGLRSRFGIRSEIGGKTGTTNNNADAWFIAVAPKIAAGAWVGGEDRATHIINRGEGSAVALPIVGKFLQKIYADKSLGITPEDKFLPPIGVVRYDCEEGAHTESRRSERESEFFD